MLSGNMRKGAALLMSMIVLAVLSVWAVSICSISGSNVQLANNQHLSDSALCAAESGLECGKYLIIRETLSYLEQTGSNFVSDAQANTVWATLCSRVQFAAVGGQVPVARSFTDAGGSGEELVTGSISMGQNASTFRMRFYRYDSDPRAILLESSGTDGAVTRKVSIATRVKKNAKVLEYAIASRGRMWLTGDSTIHGDVFSSWDRTDISPFNVTSDSRIEGTINTVLKLDDIRNRGAFQLETLDADGNPIFDADGNRVTSPQDQIQGYNEGINYSQADMDMPGMDISHYNTDEYKQMVATSGNGDIPASSTIRTEYFPHKAGNYSQASSSSSLRLSRQVYENQTFNNVRLPENRNALFKNCTFEGVLYVDCYKSGSSKYNNVRFENCAFNGVIVTNTPQVLKWQYNCLYFTGAATFNNTSSVQEATILAPHFNVNLGNTNPVQGDNNVLTGAIVGGIVDVRGNAQINGTIISMCDTTQWSSGYVTNIGATLNDGGSETTEPGDIGIINITPEPDRMLPSGIITPIVIQPLQNTYCESF